MTPLHFSPTDWLLLGGYVALILWAGLRLKPGSAGSFLLADRDLGTPLFTATLVVTWYGGVLGAGEFVYSDGVAAWLANGVPYYVFGIAFAVLLARRVRAGSGEQYTIPDRLGREYGRPAALLGAALTFLYASPAPYVLMLGTLLEALFGWPRVVALLAGLAVCCAVVYRGGFLSDIRVNAVQFALLFTGFVAAGAWCFGHYGLAPVEHLPAAALRPMGIHGAWWFVAWACIALTTLTDPGFHQRCFAARTPRVAVAGITAAVGCWLAVDFLTTSTGLYARSLAPGLNDAVLAFPALAARAIPHGLRGLFFVGMLAPTMAATVSYTFIAALTVGRDFIWRLRRDADESRVPRYTQAGLVAAAAFAVVLAYAIPSVVAQWYLLGSVYVPGMLPALIGSYTPVERRPPPRAALASMAAGSFIALAWTAWGVAHGGVEAPSFPWGVQPMFPGLAASLALWFAPALLGRARRTPAGAAAP